MELAPSQIVMSMHTTDPTIGGVGTEIRERWGVPVEQMQKQVSPRRGRQPAQGTHPTPHHHPYTHTHTRTHYTTHPPQSSPPPKSLKRFFAVFRTLVSIQNPASVVPNVCMHRYHRPYNSGGPYQNKLPIRLPCGVKSEILFSPTSSRPPSQASQLSQLSQLSYPSQLYPRQPIPGR